MASVLDLVKHYQRSIEKYPNDEQKILKCIDKLYNLGVTVQHLQDTGVGRTVNALRKEPGEVGQAARALVLKWKVMVAAEESDQEGDHNADSTNYSSHDNGRDYESNSSKSRSKHEASERSDRTPKTEEKYHKHTNGNYSGSKRKYQSSEEEGHDTKKSKYLKDNGYTVKSESKSRIEPERARSDSEDSQDESSQSDSNSEDSQSEEERVPEVKPKVENKHDQIETHKSLSHTKHSSSSRDKHKQESSHQKQDKEKYDEHNSSSDKRHSSDKSKEKSQSSHSHRSSREHEKSAEKKDKEHRHSEKERTNKEESSSKNSDKHRSSNSSDKYKTSSNTEKHKSVSSSDKHKSSSNTDKHKSSNEHKHRSSSSSEKNKSNSSDNGGNSEKNLPNNSEKQNKPDKERHKRSYENEVSNDKYKTIERSGKDEQIKEKSKEKHTSKDKESHKVEKKHSSKDSGNSKRKSESSHSHNTSESNKKSKHKSSSSKHKSKSTEEKEKQPKKGEDSDDGIDCGSGASFAEALGMFVSPTKPKKKSLLSKENLNSPNSPNYDLSPASLLAPSRLAPLPSLEVLALPEISPNYRPRPPPKTLPHFNDEDAMTTAISSKNQRTKVYSGNKTIGKITSLYEMCVQVLQEHIEALEYTGGVPYEILKPVVDKATPQQLFVLEHYNPYLMEDTDHLWQKYCERSFRNKRRQEMETWREMYIRCQEEQEIKLKSLTANIKMTQEAKKAPIKQTKMAYVDSVVKPPRNVAKKQAQHGTAFAATASPAARVASLSTTSNVLKGGRAAPAPVLTSSNFKPKKAPLMQKALQFMRGRKR